MTDNFKFIYKILRALEAAMDYPEFNILDMSADKLDIPPERWTRYIEMLLDMGYIKGIRVYKDVSGDVVEDNGIRITLKGLEYLSENTIMQRMYKTAKGIKDLI